MDGDRVAGVKFHDDELGAAMDCTKRGADHCAGEIFRVEGECAFPEEFDAFDAMTGYAAIQGAADCFDFGQFWHVHSEATGSIRYGRKERPMAEQVECIFCRIVRGEIPADLVYQDAR